MTNLEDIEELKSLSPEERELALKILQEYSSTGISQSYNNIIQDDYKEIPVDIITFIKDPRYLGKAWHTSTGKCKLFPYWEEKLKILFPDPYTTAVNNFIESGARGLGKSEIAVTCGLYLMYRAMCLKNPLEHYNLKPTEKLTFAFMNITEALAYDIGVAKFQATVQLSPWFMERGILTGKNEIVWNPPDFIKVVVGSQPRHVIGQPILYCLDGDTPILTDSGVFAIKDLVDKKIKVPTINSYGNIEMSEECTVQPTGISDVEYEIELEDGTIIKCTPNHKFMLKDGSYKEAQYLTPEDELFDVQKYGYIYKVTNSINNKIYIGQKKSHVFLDKLYLGSGKLIRRAIQKYGKDYFRIELLCWCESKEALNDMEKFYIQKFNSDDINIGYNIARGGQGGDLGPQVNKKISEAMRGKKLSNATKLKISKSLLGRHPSEQTLIKLSSSHKGKKLNLGDEERIRRRKHMKQIQNSYQGINKGKIVINNGFHNKYIDKDDTIPDGYKIGNIATSGPHNMTKYYSDAEAQHKNSISKSGCNNSMYGNGYRISGGKNGKAIKDYWFKDVYFDCRKALVTYLKQIDPTISVNLIRNIENNNYGIRTKTKYAWVIECLKWRLKDEN